MDPIKKPSRLTVLWYAFLVRVDHAVQLLRAFRMLIAAIIAVVLWQFVNAHTTTGVLAYKFTLVFAAVVAAYWIVRLLMPYVRPHRIFLGMEHALQHGDQATLTRLEYTFRTIIWARALITAAVILGICLGL